MDEEKEYSEFNSSLQYLWRISNLIWSAHVSSMNAKTVTDEVLILEQLHIELDPEMSDDERKAAEDLRVEVKKSYLKADIRKYFIHLNRFAHKKGLVLKKVQKRAGVISND
jgi:hypothetical protein